MRTRSVRHRVPFVIAVLFLLASAWFTWSPPSRVRERWVVPEADFVSRYGGNVISRYMTIESLVERGTLAATRSPMVHTCVDKIKVGHDFYSDKPPTFSFLATAWYGVLHRVFELGFASSFRLTDFWMVIVLISLPVAIGIIVFGCQLNRQTQSALKVTFLVLAFAFGTLLLSYSVTFNNHVPAAVLLLASFVLVRQDTLTPRRSAAAGFVTALAAVIDIPAGGVFWLAWLVVLAVRFRNRVRPYLLGSAVPVLLHAVLQTLVVGTPLPAELHPQYWQFAGSHWTNPQGIDSNPEGACSYLLHTLVGPRGWLTVTPWLVFGLFEMARRLWTEGIRRAPWLTAAAAAIVVMVGYYTLAATRRNYGGWAWGMRWYLAVTPIVGYYSACWFVKTRSRWLQGLFGIALAVSIAYASCGAVNPWAMIEDSELPPVTWLRQFVLYPYQGPLR